MSNGLCNILFCGYSASEPYDESGCLKPDGHFDHHVFMSDDGKLIAWEDDEECTCGCWDNIEHDTRVCMVYWEVKTII